MRYSVLVLLVFELGSPAFAQSFLLGLKAGVPMTEYFDTGAYGIHGGGGVQYSAATRRYVIGASAEWRFRYGLGLEVDALYHRMGYVHNEFFNSSASGSESTTIFDVKGSSWDIPILTKYRFAPSQRLFVTGGYVLRHLGPVRARGVTTSSGFHCPVGQVTCSSRELVFVTVTTKIDTGVPPDLQDRNFSGLTVGGGVEFRHSWLRLQPEFRFTRWITNIEGIPENALRMKSNQAEFLLGFLF